MRTDSTQSLLDGHHNLAEISPVGVPGDPTRASAEAGYALQDAANAVYLEIVKEALRAHGGAASSLSRRGR